MTAKPSSNQSKMGCSTIFLGVLLIAALVFIAPRLFNGEAGDTAPDDTVSSQGVDDGIDLGNIVVSEQVDRDGCPLSTASSLSNVETFYVVAPDSQISEGTDVFVRLYQDGVAIEDLSIITADRDYSSTCINFVFETPNGRDFESGDYEAEFWVNGNSYDSVRFQIQ